MMHLIHILSNDNLSIFENFVVWINFFGACFAFYFNKKASKFGIPRFRKINFMISGLAALYIIGYLLLLLTDPSYLVWSSVFRGFSILVWPMVWILPAITSINLWRELQLRVMEEVDK